MTDIFPKNSSKKQQQVYNCNLCNIKTSNKKDYNKHILTTKHKNRTIIYNLEHPTPAKKMFACNKCQKTYKVRNSLWYHEQKCEGIEMSNNVPINIETPANKPSGCGGVGAPTEQESVASAAATTGAAADTGIDKNMIDILINENKDFKNIILELVKSNVDLQKQMLSVCQNLQPVGNTTITNSHNNNKTFNLQFFLNEQCKDAMNISDFVNTFDLKLSDLESVGKLGYVEGITKIMVNKLKDMDIHKRPMHCSDVKRETMYVKDEDTWEKENISYPKLRKAIKQVSHKNMNLLSEWRDKYPESKRSDSHYNDHYMLLIKQTMGAAAAGDIEENETKIIRKIAKEVVIDKL